MRRRRRTDPPPSTGEAPIRELDRVCITRDVSGDDDRVVPKGASGTVVAIYAEGEAFEVEFTEPLDTLATVESSAVRLIERAAG